MAFPILRRPDLVAWLLFALAPPALAANAVFHCERADNANSVPCSVRLVPSEPTKAVIEARPDKAVEIAPGRYEIRAGSPGFALASDASYTAREVPPGSPSDRVRLSLVPGGSVYIDPSAVPSPGAVQLVSLSTGKADVLFVDREREIPVPAGKLVAAGADVRENVTVRNVSTMAAEKFGLRVNPDARVGSLSVGERRCVGERAGRVK